MATYSDNFNRASLGAAWAVIWYTMQIVSSVYVSASNYALAIYTAIGAQANGYSKVKLTSATTSAKRAGACARIGTANDGNNEYMALTNGTTVKLWKVVAGVMTEIGSAPHTAAANDVVEIRCNGTTVQAWVNGSQKVSITDTSLSTGRFGFVSWDGSYTYFDDFECGDIAAGGVAVPFGNVNRLGRGLIR